MREPTNAVRAVDAVSRDLIAVSTDMPYLDETGVLMFIPCPNENGQRLSPPPVPAKERTTP